MIKHSLLGFLGATAGRLRRDERGGVVLIFALAVMPLLLAVGAAVDYAGASRRRAEIQNATDAAILAAVGFAEKRLRDTGAGAATPEQAIRAATTYAQALFAADAGVDAELSLDMRFANGRFSATGEGKSEHPAAFMQLAGMTSIPVGSRAEANSMAQTYRDISLLLDVSHSMGLAVDKDAQRKLFVATKAESTKDVKVGCTFACHSKTSDGPRSTMAVARGIGVKLRVDAMRDAVRNLLRDARRSGQADAYRFAMHTTDRQLKRLTDFTNNYATLEMLNESLDLGAIALTDPWGNDSRQDEALATLANTLAASGDGSSPANAVRWLVFVSDGLVDREYAPFADRKTGVIDPAACARIKAKNIKVAVIYTTYDPIYEDPTNPASDVLTKTYTEYVQPHNIAAAMKACASPDLYFEAKDGAAIDKAFKDIFAQSAGNRLTR